ncbi:MAG: VWA domain-containing protein [Thermoanaerobaculales bacterium]|nr:VWA domain-containing protein [Thermoanaerobaculales bacterium]
MRTTGFPTATKMATAITLAVVVLAAGAVFEARSSPSPSPAKKKEESIRAQVRALPEVWRAWLEDEVFPLITKQQKRAFLELETEAQRRAFADRLWILWGRQTGYGSAFRSIYDERLAMARSEFETTTSARARVLLIHGPPPMRIPVRCQEVFNPLDIWGWPYLEGIGEGPVVVFYQKGGLGRWEMWEGFGGIGALYAALGGMSVTVGSGRPQEVWERPEYRCPNGDTIMRLIRTAERWLTDPRFISAMYQFRPLETSEAAESAPRRFMDFSAILDADAEPMELELGSRSRSMRGGLVRVGFDITLPSEVLGTTPVGDIDVVQLDVIGEISRDLTMVDRFRYLYSVPAAAGDIGLDLERWVRPGDYVLRLKVEDAHSRHEVIVDHAFTAEEVDVVESESREELAEIMLGIPAGDAGEQPLLTLLGPPGEAVSGVRRFEALVRPEVQRVAFLLDDQPVLTKNRPPFDIDLDLGPLPRLTRVTAIAYAADGAELAREGLTLNVGRERFFVRIQPQGPDDVRGREVRVAVDVNVPNDRELASLELFWNDEGLADLTEEPREAWVVIDRSASFGLLRAVATLADGGIAEDIQFVNAPEFGSVIEVTTVELPVTVLSRGNRPVADLAAEDFTVLEDGVEQAITHCGEHRNLPVRLGMVIDTSGSMAETLPTVQRVVMGFLRELLRPRDRAFIEVFSDRPELLAPFTADFGTLEHALLSLYPDRATALYDSVIMGLFQFSGMSGRRAMVLLTDGEDTASTNTFEDVLGYAQRMGVTIYAIGVDLPTTKVMTRYQLKRLSSATGGRAFFVSEASDLHRIYTEIDRELRSQYLLAYTSSSNRPDDELRKIEVRVKAGTKVKVRTLTGYYPGSGG